MEIQGKPRRRPEMKRRLRPCQHFLFSFQRKKAFTSMSCERSHDSTRSRRRRNMINKRSVLKLVLCFAITATVGCDRLSQPTISGVWKGTIQASATGGKENWQGPAELTLSQTATHSPALLSLLTRRLGASRSRSPLTS